MRISPSTYPKTMIGSVKSCSIAGMIGFLALAAGCTTSTSESDPDGTDTFHEEVEAEPQDDGPDALDPEQELSEEAPDMPRETGDEDVVEAMDGDEEDLETDPPPPPYPCNGAEELCFRSYNEVAFATAHNAMSSRDEGWVVPNHYHAMRDQLEAGVRGFMLDTHYFLGEAYLCHGSCALGAKPLAGGLRVLTDFLDASPHEVITIIFESYISAADTEAAFLESGLDAYVHAHEADTEWPALYDMIESDERVVVFTDNEGGEPAWYHPVWDHCWETHYHFESVEELSCDMNRGAAGNPLFILNHFLTSPVAYPYLAEQVNYNPLFIDRAIECREESGRIPNFVTVDFYSIGDLLSVVDTLNGL